MHDNPFCSALVCDQADRAGCLLQAGSDEVYSRQQREDQSNIEIVAMG